jgi:hypothetical protein
MAAPSLLGAGYAGAFLAQPFHIPEDIGRREQPHQRSTFDHRHAADLFVRHETRRTDLITDIFARMRKVLRRF